MRYISLNNCIYESNNILSYAASLLNNYTHTRLRARARAIIEMMIISSNNQQDKARRKQAKGRLLWVLSIDNLLCTIIFTSHSQFFIKVKLEIKKKRNF